MTHPNYCPLCHLIVAPADPYRLERKGQAAHEGCLRREVLPRVFKACVSFLTQRGAAFEANVLEIKAKQAFSPRSFAATLRSVLRRMLAKTADKQEIAAIAQLASQTADQLYVEIDVGIAAPAAKRLNGKSEADHA